MKNSISAVIFAISIIVAAVILGNAFLNRNKSDHKISLTGLGEMDFTSDLIVWEGVFNKDNTDLRQAYADLDRDKKIIIDYLKSKGIEESGFVFS
ncbi:MAG TPA: SIMPL domain-containing protein, partial [Cyclobacteriaceae bacterium]|nr:SIMPL domain-containing protein [Cyclobacteriaceae bacterium]